MLADAGDLVGVTVTLIVNDVDPGSLSCLAVSVGESMRVTWFAGGLDLLLRSTESVSGRLAPYFAILSTISFPAIPE